MHPGLLPPPPTYPSIYLFIHLPTFPCTYTLNLHQGNEGIAIYQVSCFILFPTYLLTKPCNFMIIENNIAMTQLKVL
jgi:hypothetical protein